MQNEQLIIKTYLKYETDQLKTKQTASFAKPTVLHWINARWLAKRYIKEKSYPGENKTKTKGDKLQFREKL